MISLMLQNLGLRDSVSNLSEIEVFKEAWATKGEPGEPIVSETSEELSLGCINTYDTIRGWDRYEPITLEI